MMTAHERAIEILYAQLDAAVPRAGFDALLEEDTDGGREARKRVAGIEEAIRQDRAEVRVYLLDSLDRQRAAATALIECIETLPDEIA